MSIEMKYPFSLDANGSIATTGDSNTQTDQHLMSLISTQPGQRVMLPTYGIPSFQYLFGPNDADQQNAFLTDIKNGVNSWEPNVNVINIGFIEDPTDTTGEWDIDIDWTPGTANIGASSGVVTTTVLVGGTIVQDNITS